MQRAQGAAAPTRERAAECASLPPLVCRRSYPLASLAGLLHQCRGVFFPMAQHSSSRPHPLLAAAAVALTLAAPAATAEETGRIKLFGHRYSLIGGASMFVPEY